ncbi:tryptophan repeat gene family protein [Dasychira pudibunda nucleopolyhedrovirus]|nr:tryptophan repeat gene family protein [Dasychira pudibunda nucleopolyhedrovirus]WHM28423.1 trgf [Dasychira pudibunda nucleopolyhedrovirus]
MAPTRALRLALKKQDYARAADLAIESRANRLFLLDYHDPDFWACVSRNCYNRDKFLSAFGDKIDWNEVSASPLTTATARTFAAKLNWARVSRQPFLRQQFIYEFGDRLDMQVVSATYNNLSLAVQQKFAAALNWNRVVLSHYMLPEWFEPPICDFINFDAVAKHKHLDKSYINAPHCINKINLGVYMRNINKISDALIVYCLREGRVHELRAVSGAVPWADHMRVFDEYPGLANTLRLDWASVSAWTAACAPPAHHFRRSWPAAFEREFVNSTYWDKFIEYASGTTSAASAAFALFLFDNFKSRVDWRRLQVGDRFVNLAALHRARGPLVALEAAGDDERVWRAYGRFVSGGDAAHCELLIPINMSVRDAYRKMPLVQACASQHEHDKARTCERRIALNGGEDALLNWNLLSATQQVCPFNLRHLQNANAQTYRRDNPHYVQDVYEKMIAAQMNINEFL